MSKVIAFVGKIDGQYFASTPEGQTRPLQAGDPIYEGEAVFSQNENPEGKYIELIKTNGESLVYTDTSYVILDPSVTGNDKPEADNRYVERGERPDVVLDGRGRDEGHQEQGDHQPLDAALSSGPQAPAFHAQLITPAVAETITGTDYTGGADTETPAASDPSTSSSATPNTPPTSSDSEVTGIEDTVYAFTLEDFNYSDQDGDPFTDVRIDSLPDEGILYYNGAEVHAGDVIPAGDVASGLLTFMPDADENGVDYTTFTYSVGDGTDFSSSPSNMVVNIDPVDDPTSLTVNDGAYTENDSPILLDSSLALSEPDCDVTGATVTIKGGLLSGDILSAATIGTSITATYNAATGVLTLTGTDTAANYQSVLASVSFHSTSEDPTVNGTDESRTIEWSVTSSDSTVTTEQTFLTVTPLTDAPELEVSGSAEYHAGSAAVNALTSGSITDVDDTHMDSASVAITSDFYAGDVLAAVTTGTSITASYNAATGVLTLTGTDTVANYKAVLESVKYSSTAEFPSLYSNERTLTWTVTDANSDGAGAGTSQSVTSTVDIIGIPHAFSAADKEMTEKYYDGDNTTVSGNLLTDGTDNATGVDYVPLGGTAQITDIKYYDASGHLTTATLTTTVTTLDTQYGSLTINRDTGAYTFTSDETLDHPAGNDLTETFQYNFTYSTDSSVSNFATQNIVIHDGADPVVSPDSVTVAESSLSGGSSPDALALVQSGSLHLTGGSDTFDATFTNDTKTYLEGLGLKSDGTSLTYTISADGHTVTAKAGLDTVFVVELTNPTADNAGYSVTLFGGLDSSSDVVMDLPFSVTDHDGDEVTSSFGVTITDDNPVAYQAADVHVTEKSYDGTENMVAGNLFSDGTDHATGVDFVPVDGTGQIYQVKYYDASGTLTTATLTEAVTTLDTQYGELTIDRDAGSYIFVADSTLDHPASNELTETIQYNFKDTADGDISNFATQNIIIDDGTDPAIASGASNAFYEANLSNGSDPDSAALTKTGSLNVTGGSDTFDTQFSSATITYLEGLNLKSNGIDVAYSISADGHTITATDGTNTVFSLNITNPTADNAGYSFTLGRNFDSSSDVVMNLPYTVTDHDGDKANSTLVITVYDDVVPTAYSVTTNEDTAVTFTTNADVDKDSTSVSIPGHGTAILNDNGSISYTPTGNYSGEDTFTYTTHTDQGDVTTTVTVTVNPVSDAPSFTGTTSYETNEDTSVALTGLTIPSATDTTDQNSAGTAGDHSEKIGYITLTSIDHGVEIYNGGTKIFTGDGTNTLKIAIVDDLGNINTTYHYSDLNPDSAGVVKLTEAQYEALTLKPSADSGADIDFKVNATSYETDDSGNKLTDVAGTSASKDVHVEVNAVTDHVGVVLADPGVTSVTGNEDSWIRIDSLFTPSYGDNTDGSETHTMTISGLPAGWKYSTTGSGSGSSITDGAFTVSAGSAIYVKPPTNNSADVTGLTATVKAVDSDDDSSVTPATETASVGFGITVVPVSDAPSISGSGTGPEDSKIAFTVNASATDTSTATGDDNSTETITSVTITGIPDGSVLYASDGTTVLTVTGGSYTVVTGLGSPTYSGNFYIKPPQDSNTDIKLSVTATSQESSGAPLASKTGNVTIDVVGVVDTSIEDTHDGRLYVQINDTLTQAGVDTNFTVDEDNPVDLKISLNSYENVTHSTTDSSEKITVVIQNADTGGGSDFYIVNASNERIGTLQSDGWHLTESEAEEAQVMPGFDLSGSLNLNVITTVKDMNASGGVDDTVTQTDRVVISVTPVTDVPSIVVREVFTQEDKAVELDIRPLMTDTSEHALSVNIADIPVGASLSLVDGTVLFTATAGHTEYFINVGDTTDVSSDTLTMSDLAEIQFLPPAESNEEIILTITPTIQDGTAAPASADIPVEVHIQGVADTPVLTLTDGANNSVSLDGTPMADGTHQTYTSGAIVITGTEITSTTGIHGIALGISADSGEHILAPTDTSEVISYVLDNVPDSIKLISSADGSLIGTYMGAGTDGGAKWSLTQAEMDVMLFKTPVNYSGIITGMGLVTVVTENDGDSTSIVTPFTLNIDSVVSTDSGIIGGITGPEDGLLVLGFGSTADSSEHVTSVTVAEDGVPTGYTLMVTDDGENWHAATASGGVYDLTGYFEGHAALQVNAGEAYAQAYGNGGTLTGVSVTIQDVTDDGGAQDIKTVTGSMAIDIVADADAPDIHADSSSVAGTSCAGAVNLGLSADFADMDGSETHYFVIKNVPDGCLLTNARFNGDGTWYVAPGDLTSVTISASYGATSGTYHLVVEGYAVENSNGDTAISDITVDYNLTVGCSGEDGTDHAAQAPTLVVQPVSTVEDSTPPEFLRHSSQ